MRSGNKFFRICIMALALATALPLAASAASADWPKNPIKILVPYSAGGAADLATRAIAPEMSKRLGVLSEQVEQKEAQSEELDTQIAVKEKAKATIEQVNKMGHSIPLFPGVHFTDDEAARLKSLARKGVGIDRRADALKKELAARDEHIRELDGQIQSLQHEVRVIARDRDTWKANYNRLWAEVKEFYQAIKKIPNRLRAFIAEIMPRSRDREVTR